MDELLKATVVELFLALDLGFIHTPDPLHPDAMWALSRDYDTSCYMFYVKDHVPGACCDTSN